MITDDSKKHLARLLRRRLEGRVPSHILSLLSDDELIERYNEHHAFKLSTIKRMLSSDDESAKE